MARLNPSKRWAGCSRRSTSAPYLSTKVVLDTATAGRHSRARWSAVSTTALERLNRNSVDLLLLHNPIEPAASQPERVTAEHVLRATAPPMPWSACARQGLTRYIGFTALGNVDGCKQVIDSGRFDAAQVYYNLLNPSAARPCRQRWTRSRLRRADRRLQSAGNSGHGDPRIRGRRARKRWSGMGAKSLSRTCRRSPVEERRAQSVLAALGTPTARARKPR